MPNRPPRQWMRDCIAGVASHGGAVDPGAVCGAQWQRMDHGARARALRRHEGNPMKRRHAHRHTHAALATIGHAARSAHAELEHRGLPHTAHAVAVLGASTMAIGSHVRGWARDVAGVVGRTAYASTLPAPRRRRSTHKRRRLTAKQIAAGFGGKRRKAHRRPHKARTRRHLTAAQKAAGFGGKRAMHGKRRKHGHKRKGSHKRRHRRR